MRVTTIALVIGALRTVLEGLKRPRRMGNRRTNPANLNYSIIEIDQNHEKLSVDPSRFAVTQTIVKDLQIRLVWKTPKNAILIIVMVIHKAFYVRGDIDYELKKKREERKWHTRIDVCVYASILGLGKYLKRTCCSSQIGFSLGFMTYRSLLVISGKILC